MLRSANRVGTIYRKSPDLKTVSRNKQNQKEHLKSTFTDKNTEINSNISQDDSYQEILKPVEEQKISMNMNKTKTRNKKISCHQIGQKQLRGTPQCHNFSHLSQSTVKDQNSRNQEDSLNFNFNEEDKVKIAESDPNSIVRKLTYLNNIFKQLKALKENKLSYETCLLLSRIEDKFINIERQIIRQIQDF